MVHHEVFKDSPSKFSYACMLAKIIGCMDDYSRETRGNGSCMHNIAVYDLVGYLLIDLDAV